jgi:hypothetical protein
VPGRPVIPNVLLDLKVPQLSNDPWAAEKRDHQRGEDRQNRPKSNVSEDVKVGKFGVQGIKQKVKHRSRIPTVYFYQGILGI